MDISDGIKSLPFGDSHTEVVVRAGLDLQSSASIWPRLVFYFSDRST
jgi:hypothetical protein